MKLKLDKCMNSSVYKNPYQKTNNYYLEVNKLSKQLENAMTKRLNDIKNKFSNNVTKLDVLSPLKTLSRGYCIAEKDNKIVAQANNLKIDMEIDLRFRDGSAKAKIIDLEVRNG